MTIVSRWLRNRAIRFFVVFIFALLACLSTALNLWSQPKDAHHPPFYRYTGNIQIDLHKTSFSSYGSYMAFSLFPQGLYLRELHGNSGRGALLTNAVQVELIENGKSVPFTARATPVQLQLISSFGTVDICFAQPDLIRLRAHGVSIRLTSSTHGNYAVEHGSAEWEIHGSSKYRLGALKGTMQLTQHWKGTSGAPIVAEFLPQPSMKNLEAFIGDYRVVWNRPAELTQSYEDALTALAEEYHQWLEKMPSVSPQFGPTAEQAAYVDWSAVVEPGGFLTRPAMLMSKNWMASLWSWDNCFNAMAFIATAPKIAWDQFMIPFDNQDQSGQLPDVMNDEQESWKYTKPPVQGWVLAWMIAHSNSIDSKKLNEIYEPLSKWTDWYFRYRDADRDGLPEYNQGDDSGWDNTTIFFTPPPLETPDLAALLVVQMDELSKIAARLGKQSDAQMWHRRSDRLLNLSIRKYWRNGQFVALRAFDHRETPTQSLILYLPLVLGKRLPQPYRDQLIARLMENGRFLTANGFATEELNSPYFNPNGYWRGPIWAPTMMMLAQGQQDAGRPDLAREMRVRYCRMAARSGFAENYQPITGAGSFMPDLNATGNDGRDPSYTWSASVFLIFAHQLSQSGG
ncbi:MAG: amylo-alpha-1,6-glucosidase [Acidobacteriaceae bacterium]